MSARRFTPAMLRELYAVREFELGPMPRPLPFECADGRIFPALQRRGLVGVVSDGRVLSGYCLTPKGHSVLDPSRAHGFPGERRSPGGVIGGEE